MTHTITPPAAKLAKWRKMRDDNQATEELVDMARWLLHKLADDPRPREALSARVSKFLDIFAAIQAIHHAEGSLPYRVYQYRYDTMSAFVGFAAEIESSLHNTLNGCL